MRDMSRKEEEPRGPRASFGAAKALGRQKPNEIRKPKSSLRLSVLLQSRDPEPLFSPQQRLPTGQAGDTQHAHRLPIYKSLPPPPPPPPRGTWDYLPRERTVKILTATRAHLVRDQRCVA